MFRLKGWGEMAAQKRRGGEAEREYGGGIKSMSEADAGSIVGGDGGGDDEGDGGSDNGRSDAEDGKRDLE